MKRNDGSSKFSHLDEEGSLAMVDVGDKKPSRREAVATALVRMSPSTLQLLAAKALPKGDVLVIAKVAGIFAAKQTAFLIPLTHPLALSFIDIAFAVDEQGGTIEVVSTVRTEGKTGVEIEAMTACSIAALTIYDMCKSVEKEIVIADLRLLEKSGGKSGRWKAQVR